MIQIRKKFGEPINVYESISPFYYTLKFFGLASYDLNFKNGKITTSFINYIIMLCHIALCLYFYYEFLQDDVATYSPEGKSVLIYGFLFFYHFQYYTIVLIFIFNFLKRKNIEKLLKLLETFDDHCEKMRWKFKIDHKRNYWSLIFWICLHIILLMVVYPLQMSWVPPDSPDLMDHINMIFYCSMTKAFVLSTLQFIFSVASVASRFEILNQITK